MRSQNLVTTIYWTTVYWSCTLKICTCIHPEFDVELYLMRLIFCVLSFLPKRNSIRIHFHLMTCIIPIWYQFETPETTARFSVSVRSHSARLNTESGVSVPHERSPLTIIQWPEHECCVYCKVHHIYHNNRASAYGKSSRPEKPCNGEMMMIMILIYHVFRIW